MDRSAARPLYDLNLQTAPHCFVQHKTHDETAMTPSVKRARAKEQNSATFALEPDRFVQEDFSGERIVDLYRSVSRPYASISQSSKPAIAPANTVLKRIVPEASRSNATTVSDVNKYRRSEPALSFGCVDYACELFGCVTPTPITPRENR